MIISVPTGSLKIQSGVPIVLLRASFTEMFTPVVRQLIVERIVGFGYARDPPMVVDLSYKESASRGVLLVA